LSLGEKKGRFSHNKKRKREEREATGNGAKSGTFRKRHARTARSDGGGRRGRHVSYNLSLSGERWPPEDGREKEKKKGKGRGDCLAASRR